MSPLAIALAVALLASTPSAAPVATPPPPERPLRVEITGAYDGDTLRTRLPSLPKGLRGVSIRVRGVDTPERGHHADCPSEMRRAREARAFVLSRIAVHPVATLHAPSWGKWGGRFVATVELGGKNLAAALIERGLGRAYDGGAREGWCAEEDTGQ